MYTDKLKEINKVIDKLTYKQNRWSVLTDLFELSAITISNQFDRRKYIEREKRYADVAKKYDEKEIKLMAEAFALIYKLLIDMVNSGFDDYLGKLYMESGTSSDKTGQFFTPYNVSRACAELTLPDTIASDRVLKMNEPTCGSGGMILAMVEAMHKRNFNYSNNLLVVCSDIDSRCVHMAYLQLGLAGIPAVIYHQNALTLQTWDEWHTPALCMNWLRFRNYM